MKPGVRGRGAAGNPGNRFESLHYEPDPELLEAGEASVDTVLYRDASRSVLSPNDSPDVGFDVGLNPYRGCEHGCSYCYARPYHEYLGFSAGLDFETRIVVKEDAPQLLRKELGARSWRPRTIGLSGVTDPYQPVERELRITRRCLEVLAECRNPVAVITKNAMVARDADLLSELARHDAGNVCISINTLDFELAGKLEPRASRPAQRLQAIRELSAAGIPVGAFLAPIIPGMTEHEVLPVLSAVAEAGGRFACYTVLRLPLGVGALFEEWLDLHYPDHKSKVMRRVRELRQGELDESRFGARMHGSGALADRIEQLFAIGCDKAGLERRTPKLSTAAFRPPDDGQLRLFD